MREDLSVLAMTNTAKEIRRTMRAESEDFERTMERCDRDLWDEDPAVSGETDEDEPMEITAIRSPITIQQPAPQQPEPPPPTNKASTLAKAALVAVGLLGGGGLGAAVPWMLGAYNQQPGATTTIENTHDMGVGVEVVQGGAME